MSFISRLMVIAIGIYGFWGLPNTGCVMGGASDTETTFEGTLFDSQGNPAPNALINLYPNDFHPAKDQNDLIISTSTNQNGKYHLDLNDSINLDHYNLFGELNHEVVLINNVNLTQNRNDTLAPSRTLEILLHTANYLTSDSAIAYIPGTGLFVRCRTNELSRIENVPPDLSTFQLESRGEEKSIEFEPVSDTVLVQVQF